MGKVSLSDVVAAEGAALMALPGVVGVAEGSVRGSSCIVVYVAGDEHGEIPSSLSGYTVVVRVSGEIKAQKRDGLD